jgi:quercetin dioxygenase-like cupin family protein
LAPEAVEKRSLEAYADAIGPGDIVIIPAGVAHGFAVIETPVTYLVIRVDSGHSLPLK